MPLNSTTLFNEENKIIHCSTINEEIQIYWFYICSLSTNYPPWGDLAQEKSLK